MHKLTDNDKSFARDLAIKAFENQLMYVLI